jgi:hypothetical protein
MKSNDDLYPFQKRRVLAKCVKDLKKDLVTPWKAQVTMIRVLINMQKIHVHT